MIFKNSKMRMILFLFLAFILFVLIFIFKYLSSTAVSRDNKKYTSFHSIVSLNDKKDLVSYVYISDTPIFMFRENEISYYYISDGTFLYIASISDDVYQKLLNINYSKDRIKLVGISKETTFSIAESTLSYFNTPFPSSNEDIIYMDDFKDYYCFYYLDLVSYDGSKVVFDSKIENKYRRWYLIFGGVGVLFLFLAEYNRKIDDEDI